MDAAHTSLDAWGVAWRLGATLLFVALNGFFVAAEFALVKVRASRIDSLAASGKRAAETVQHLLRNLDRYLSACQLGITLASLALGALGEPAVSVLLLAAARGLGWTAGADAAWIPVVSITLAFAVITTLHMTVGEQAPKMWALQRAESTALRTALTLRIFTFCLGPFIVALNWLSNRILRSLGLPVADHEPTHSAEEIRSILSLSARAGNITDRERQLTQNVLRMVELEVRHLVVPRVDVEFLSAQRSLEENLRQLEQTQHSRIPMCEAGLDSVIGLVHTKDVLAAALRGDIQDLAPLAREVSYVSDTMALSDFLLDLQQRREHCAVVIDEHGTAIGLAFLEDALEEIVGPLGDEFDTRDVDFRRVGEDDFEVHGRMALPEALARMGIEIPVDEREDEETLGGLVTARLGRLPLQGDLVRLGSFQLEVLSVERRRIQGLRVRRLPAEESDPTELEVTPGGAESAS